MSGSDSSNERLNRGFNARLMAAEASLLSPFVSPLVTPFRHVLLGRGGHTLPALVAELGTAGTRGDSVQRRLALLAWTLRGAAAAMAGASWDRGDLGDRGGLGDNGDCGDMGDTGDSWGGLGDRGDTGDSWGGLGDRGDTGDSWDREDTWGYGDTWERGGPGDNKRDLGDSGIHGDTEDGGGLW